MAESSLTISAEQRNALYSVIRAELGALGDLQTAFFASPRPDLEYLYRHGRRLTNDLRLLVDGLGWERTAAEGCELSIPPEELRSILLQVRDTAVSAHGGLRGDNSGFQEELGSLVKAREVCDELLSEVASQPGLKDGFQVVCNEGEEADE
jgi:hypothetical protein